jgi:predicted TIM-barrel fold metal-dependent hydrolase
MAITDVQVHAYERDHPDRPWAAALHGPPEVTGDQMVAAMDDVGVDGALLVSVFTMYRYDPSYALEVAAAHPGRFGVIAPFDPDGADVAGAVADWSAQPDSVGARLMLYAEPEGGADHPGVNQMFAAAGRHGLPLNTLCWGRLPLVGELARRHPDTQVVIDHIGMHQRFEPPPPDDPFGALPELLALAELSNVAVKISGAGTLSQVGYPFDDVWSSLEQIFEAFGLDRCMWGTDWTRATAFLDYREGVDAFRHSDRLSDSDKATLMGGSLERIYGWSPHAPAE